jgi:hypothetical protein
MIYSNDRGSVIDSFETKAEELSKEFERCKDYNYFFVNYQRVVKEDDQFVFAGRKFNTEAELHKFRREFDSDYGVFVNNALQRNRNIISLAIHEMTRPRFHPPVREIYY